LRYPQDIFSVQAAMFATYHMQNPAVFYNKEDQWEVPSIDSREQAIRMEPYYTIMKLPGQGDAEFIQMLPFTPRQKDNLAAWMVARSDGEHYGKLVVFQFPKQKVVFGPRQVVARINQDQVIAPQITLWNQQGSEVIQGTLLVIPIEESLIYIRPLYLRAAGGRIPELKRVIVAYHNRIVMDETLDRALARIFPRDGEAPPAQQPIDPATLAQLLSTGAAPGTEGGEPSGAPGATPGVTPAPATGAAPAPSAATPSAVTGSRRELVQRADAHYRRAIEAQRAGDWARYGDEINRLGDVLRQLQEIEARPQ
jgi:uncharacterized membrane protein (UPF0182 family)